MSPAANDGPPARRFALISIACFWTFYFAIWSLRFALVYPGHDTMKLGARAVVSIFSSGLTLAIYGLMRRLPPGRWGLSIGLALALAAPAAILYSAFDWYVFSHLGEGIPMSWRWSGRDPAVASAPSSPGTPSLPMSVGTMPHESDDDWSPLQSMVDQACSGYFFFIAWETLYLALSYATQIGALERYAADLRSAAKSAELRALRYQVNPHFLFNTLNSLSSLVMTGRREQAEQMIVNLATFFRTSLTGDPTEDVPLSEEVRLQRLYLAIEQVRFPDRLLVAIDLPADLEDACVPGLILQPLVENAVKHAVSRSRNAVTIRISAQRCAAGLCVVVDDDGDAADQVRIGSEETESGLGLRNVRDRLAARFGDVASCRWSAKSTGGFTVTLAIPLVHDDCR